MGAQGGTRMAHVGGPHDSCGVRGRLMQAGPCGSCMQARMAHAGGPLWLMHAGPYGSCRWAHRAHLREQYGPMWLMQAGHVAHAGRSCGSCRQVMWLITQAGHVAHAGRSCGSCRRVMWLSQAGHVAHAGRSCGSCKQVMWLMQAGHVAHSGRSCGSCRQVMWLMLAGHVAHASWSCGPCMQASCFSHTWCAGFMCGLHAVTPMWCVGGMAFDVLIGYYTHSLGYRPGYRLTNCTCIIPWNTVGVLTWPHIRGLVGVPAWPHMQHIPGFGAIEARPAPQSRQTLSHGSHSTAPLGL